MSTPRISLWKEDVLMVASIALAVLGFRFGPEAQDAEITAQHALAAAEMKADVSPQDVVWMRLPLECEQYIAMRGAGQQWKRKPVCADFSKEQQ